MSRLTTSLGKLTTLTIGEIDEAGNLSTRTGDEIAVALLSKEE
jgi:hypothetical protein